MQDWDQLRYVLAIAREGGLSGAARALGVNHATVSRQLARAEEAAGLALFTRLATGLEPTEAGAEAARRAEAVEAEILALDLSLAARNEGEEGPLLVTAPPLVVAAGLAQDITDFKAEFPGVEVTLSGENTIANLHRREADVAIRVSREPAESLWGRVITQQRAGWFGAPELIADLAPVWAGEPGRVPVISFTAYEQPVPPSLSRHLPGAETVITCDDMVSAVALARAGMGILRAPHFLGAREPGLVRVPGLELVEYMPIWALTHPDLRRVGRVAQFMRFVGARFGARAALYLGEGAK